MSEETADVNVIGRYFADIDYVPSTEYSNSAKLPIKSYAAYGSFHSLNGTPYEGWDSQTVYAYLNDPVPETLYKFYSFFYDSGIPSVFPYAPTPFNLGSGFSWNLIPEGDHYKIAGMNYDYYTGFQLEECEITYSEGVWSTLQNCQSQPTKSFNVNAPGEPGGDIYFLYKTGNVNGSDIYLPYHFYDPSVPGSIGVPSNIDYVIEHFKEVSYPQDRIEKDVGVKINVPSTAEGNVTVTPTDETYTVPSDQYYIEIFSEMGIPTPIDSDYLPEGDSSFGFGLNFDEMMDYQKLSFVRDFSPEGKTSSTTLNLPVVSGEENERYAIVLTSGGNFHVIIVLGTNSVVLKDISISGSNDSSRRFLFELTGNDAGSLTSCVVAFNRKAISDESPNEIKENLFEPDALLPLYVFTELSPDRMFVKVPDTSLVNSIVVECEDKDGNYKVRKYFHMSTPIQSAFDYPSNFSQSEVLSFNDVYSEMSTIAASYSSDIDPDAHIFVFSKVGDNYNENYGYSIETETHYLTISETVKNFLDQMGSAGETEGSLTVYITNYKNGTYRKGVLTFEQAENGETVTLNPDGSADLTWDTSNFSQCSSDLKLLQAVVPSTTDNDGEEVVTTTANSVIYIYKFCSTSVGGTIYYKRFDIVEPAQANGTGSNGTLDNNVNVPDTNTPG